jgi:hypothetical protein
MANSLDSEDGVFDGIAFPIHSSRKMEKQMRVLNDRMSRMLAADDEALRPYVSVNPFSWMCSSKWGHH